MTLTPYARTHAVSVVLIVLFLGAFIAFSAFQNKLIAALRPAQHWLTTYVPPACPSVPLS